MKKIFILISVLLLSSCMAMGKKFESLKPIEDGKAKLVFYRDYYLNGGFSCPTIKINGKKQDCLANGGYFEVDVKPGETWIYLDSRYSTHKGSIVVELKSGEIKYFEFDYNNRVGGFGYHTYSENLIERSENHSLKKLKDLNES